MLSIKDIIIGNIYEKQLLVEKLILSSMLCFIFSFSVFYPSGLGAKRTVNDPTSKVTGVNYVKEVLTDYNTGLSLVEEGRLAGVIVRESAKYNLDPLFILALIRTESTFYNWSRSGKGAVGLMQILPNTGKYVARELKIDWKGARTLYNPYLNVQMGVHYYSELKDRFSEDTMSALVAYNAGPTYLSKKIKFKKKVPTGYGKLVLAHYENLKQGVRF
ncbi:MAG: lytic transglycosylase domain-containing protein [Deltaproteobacteria bacterium]|nr:lytic transglycosylase domain-containing protein [Deltaproteobacteria bacterium]